MSLKNPPAIQKTTYNTGDPGSVPGSGRSSREGNSNPLQYSCLGNPMDRGASQAIVQGSQRVGHDWASKPPPPPWSWSKEKLSCPRLLTLCLLCCAKLVKRALNLQRQNGFRLATFYPESPFSTHNNDKQSIDIFSDPWSLRLTRALRIS